MYTRQCTASSVPRRAPRVLYCKTSTSSYRDSNRELGRNTNSLDALANLARTSRLLHRYASQELWHTLPSFAPIFWTMPEDAYPHERPRGPWAWHIGSMMPAKTLTASRPLKPDDLARLSLYAPFVRRIAPRCSSNRVRRAPSFRAAYTDFDLSPELWEMLQAIWPRNFLHLEVLEYRQLADIDRKSYAHPLHLFIGPSLKKLDFAVSYLNKLTGWADRRTDTRDPTLEVFLKQLPLLAPHITNFTFSTEVRDLAQDALSEALCALHHLSTLPALRRLDIKVPPRDELRSAEPWPTGKFAALRDLYMSAVRIDEYSITVDVREPSSTGTFHALASEILAHPSSQTSIRSLEFTLHWVEVLPPEALEPLLPLSALEDLVLVGHVCAAVDDGTLCAMAQAWNKIRRLTLYKMPHHATQATVHSLRHFARYCPQLERLDVPLSHITPFTFALPASMDHPQFDTLRPHPLKRLGVGRPELHDEAALAAYLSSLFPTLRVIEHCWEGVISNGEAWGELEEEEDRITDRCICEDQGAGKKLARGKDCTLRDEEPRIQAGKRP
ncbi:hypothetical protein K466DRAFT_653921 [Polyporus arcularius HHB13444]|uniref:F-box domain-containing protein n=1 Tax=Polyporus arcularius HHB13444 TaxID=1314778 RepID=A0A5C3PBL1_9APHY|nr:hypothetical protein K466DRAFT_653921 [Polyporus arcularius HHB13444]